MIDRASAPTMPARLSPQHATRSPATIAHVAESPAARLAPCDADTIAAAGEPGVPGGASAADDVARAASPRGTGGAPEHPSATIASPAQTHQLKYPDLRA